MQLFVLFCSETDRQIVADIRRRRDEVDSLARFVLPKTEIAASPAAAEYMKFLMAVIYFSCYHIIIMYSFSTSTSRSEKRKMGKDSKK